MHIRHQLLQLFFRHHLAVEQMHFALRVLGEARIVRHHADGGAFAVQVSAATPSRLRRCANPGFR